MDSRDERIARLASTLKSSGIAKSDSQARMLAEDMIGVEDNVQKRFDEEHSKAQEFLKTAKNLKQPLSKQADTTTVPPIMKDAVDSKSVAAQTIKGNPSDNNIPKSHDEVYTDIDFGKKPLRDLLNPAIEEIKDNVKKSFDEKSSSFDVLSPTPMNNDAGELPDSSSSAHETDMNTSPEINPDSSLNDNKGIVVEKSDSEDNTTAQINASTSDTPSSDTAAAEEKTPPTKLDTERLASLMEEDGPMEEHTREIKEKPKEIKPKEDYAENSIDLASIFGAKK